MRSRLSNGGIKVGANGQIGSIETVNGGISMAGHGVVRRRRRGQWRHQAPAGIGAGPLENVNGGVTAIRRRIGAGIVTVNGQCGSTRELR